MPTENELEEMCSQLRQQQLTLLAKVNAVETLSSIVIALICSYDNKPEFKERLEKGAFPVALEAARNKARDTTHPELAEWLVNLEVKILEDQFDRILKEVEKVRARAERKVN